MELWSLKFFVHTNIYCVVFAEDIFQDADGDDDEGEYHLSNAAVDAGDVPYSDGKKFFLII